MNGSRGCGGSFFIAGRVNAEAACTRDEVVVGSLHFHNQFVFLQNYIVVLLLVDQFNYNVAPNFVTLGWVGSNSPFVQLGIRGAWVDNVKTHADVREGHHSSDCCDHVKRSSSDATHQLSAFGSIVAAVGGSASLFAVCGGLHVLVDTYGDCLGSGYDRKLVEIPIFSLRLLKRCLQKVSSFNMVLSSFRVVLVLS